MNNDQIGRLASQLFLYSLTILFVALKLMGYITWSWWWVLSPMWIPFAIALPIFLVVLVWAALTDRI